MIWLTLGKHSSLDTPQFPLWKNSSFEAPLTSHSCPGRVWITDQYACFLHPLFLNPDASKISSGLKHHNCQGLWKASQLLCSLTLVILVKFSKVSCAKKTQTCRSPICRGLWMWMQQHISCCFLLDIHRRETFAWKWAVLSNTANDRSSVSLKKQTKDISYLLQIGFKIICDKNIRVALYAPEAEVLQVELLPPRERLFGSACCFLLLQKQVRLYNGFGFGSLHFERVPMPFGNSFAVVFRCLSLLRGYLAMFRWHWGCPKSKWKYCHNVVSID